jgi:TolB-like protein
LVRDFQLGEWLVRPHRDRIESGSKVIHVKPKSMAVLECLARARGEVVERQVFFDTIWPGGVVTDDVLTQCIVELRKAFGDSARHPQVIETIPKIGFRLIPVAAPLSNGLGVPGVTDPFKPKTRISLIIVSTILLALVFFWYLTGLRDIPPNGAADDAKSIAVLPFVDMSTEGDQGYFADGLSEELINRLAQLSGLDVAARTSSFYFKDRNDDLRSIADALGVNHMLEGSVRRDANRLRINAQLIDAKNGFHLWSRQFDQPFESYFTIQEQIAESVANALSIKLQVGELGTIPGGTLSIEAYEEILLSKRDQWKSTPESILSAIDHVKKAIEIDPEYAQAWMRLAGLYLNANTLQGTERSPDAFLQSEQALARARSLEPATRGVLMLTVIIQNKKQQWSEVEKTLKRGEGMDHSSNGDLIRAYCAFLFRVGRIQEAIPLLERVRNLLPFNSGTARLLGATYVIQGRIEEGFAEAERAFEIEGFESWDVGNGILITLSTDDRDHLLKWLERAEIYIPESRHLVMAMIELLDDHETALDWLRNTYQQSEKYDYEIAFWAAWHGDTGLALDALRRYPVPMSFWHPVMKDVRRAPGFKDLIRQIGLEEYYREFGWNDFCRPVGENDFECE